MERSFAGGPHTAARTAVVWEVLRRELDRAPAQRERLSVVDVGGGTGGFAVPLARSGHDITVVDASPDALAALTRRAADAGVGDRVRAVQGDADALADLVARRAAPTSCSATACSRSSTHRPEVARAHRRRAAPGRCGERDRGQPGGRRAGPGDGRAPRRRHGAAARPGRARRRPGHAAPPLRRGLGHRAADARPGSSWRRSTAYGWSPTSCPARCWSASRRRWPRSSWPRPALSPFRDIATQLHLLARRP